MKNSILILILVLTSHWSYSQIINTIAGNGSLSYSGDGGPAIAASFDSRSLAEDRNGNIYFSDDFSHRIRKISTSGIMSTVAGNGSTVYSGDGMPATATGMNPTDVAVDTSGNLYIADRNNHRIRKVNTAGIISTIAGTGVAGTSGDGAAATAAKISNPCSLTLDKYGNIYISTDFKVRKIDLSGTITTYAGGGGYVWFYAANGHSATGISAGMEPMGLTTDTAGNLYIADTFNNAVRKVNTAGIITTVAGLGVAAYYGDGYQATNAGLNSPFDVAVDSLNNLYISDYGNYVIRKVNMTTGIISTFAGSISATVLGDGGPATSARVGKSTGIIADNYGVVISSDTRRIRRVCFGTTIPTISISGMDTVCAGTTVSYTSSVAGGGTMPSYKWKVNGINAGTGSTFSYAPANGDVVKCILRSSATCSYPDTAASISLIAVVTPTVSPTVSISSSSMVVCSGTMVTFNSLISGGGILPIYKWQVNGVDVGTGTLPTYTYTPSNLDVINCTIISHEACAVPTVTVSPNITMTVNPSPVMFTLGTSGTYADSAVLSLSGSQIGITYNLLDGSSIYGSLAGTGSTLPFTVFSTGNYFITATSALGCSDSTNSISVTIIDTSTGIKNIDASSVMVYPNPAGDKLFVEGSQPFLLQILDLTGRVLIERTCSATKSAVDISDLKSGLYLLKVNGHFTQMLTRD